MSVVRQSEKAKDEQGGTHRGAERFLSEEEEEMTDEQKALLGDHEAAKRLTERYELLPCPCCGGQAKCFGGPSIAYVRCKACGLEICRMDADGEDIISQICAVAPKYEARLAWNTRAPILSKSEMEMLHG